MDDEEVQAEPMDVVEVGPDVGLRPLRVDQAQDGIVEEDPAAEEPALADGPGRLFVARPGMDGVKAFGVAGAEGERGFERPLRPDPPARL